MTANANVQSKPLRLIDAARWYFYYRKDEMRKFNNLAASAAVALRAFGLGLTIVDDAADWVPGIDIITIGDNILWLFAGYSAVRIVSLWWRANHRRM